MLHFSIKKHASGLKKDFLRNEKLYNEFSLVVKKIIQRLLNDEFKDAKIMNIFYRSKDPLKVEEKIIRKYQKENKLYKKLSDIEDLAGVRVVFYLENEKKRLLNIIQNNINSDDIKVEYPFEYGGYNAIHIIFKLGKDRNELPEYKKYKGLKCEIQLTSGLYHVWSEIEHDIYKPIVKKEQLETLGFARIQKHFEYIMVKYIQKASSEFEFLNQSIKDTIEANEILNPQFFKKIRKIKTNDELLKKINSINNFIIFRPEISLKIIKYIVDKKPFQPKLIKFGNYSCPSTSHSNLIKIILELIITISVVKPQKAFIALIRIKNKFNKDKEINNYIQNTIKRIIEYDYFALKYFGYRIQKAVIDEMASWSNEETKKYSDILYIIADEVLKTNFHGIEQVINNEQDIEDKVQWFQGSLGVNDDYIYCRNIIIKLLQKHYYKINKISEKKKIISLLFSATKDSIHSKDVAIQKTILNNTEEVLIFCKKTIINSENIIKKIIEEELNQINKKEFQNNKILHLISDIDISIFSDKRYKIYRLLVGYDWYFQNELDYNDAEEYRNKEIKKHVQLINKKNLNIYNEIILEILNNYKNIQDLNINYLFNLITELGLVKPKLLIYFLNKNGQKVELILACILQILLSKGYKKIVYNKIEKYITKGKNLISCFKILLNDSKDNSESINLILEKAFKIRNFFVINQILYLIFLKKVNKAIFYKKIIINTINHLTKFSESSWVNSIFPDSKFIDNLTKDDVDIILINLIHCQNINYNVEEILGLIFQHYPEEILHFFKLRLEKKESMPKLHDYRPLPTEYDKVFIDAINSKSQYTLKELLKWFDTKSYLMKDETAHFISNIFSVPNSRVLNYYRKLIKAEEFDVISYIFQNYKNKMCILPLVKQFVKDTRYNKKYKEDIRNMFIPLDVIYGDDGRIIYYENIKKEIITWKKDKNKYLRIFVEEYEKELNQMIIMLKKQLECDRSERKCRRFKSLPKQAKQDI